MRGDTRSLIHGIINLLWLPFLSDAICVVVAAVRFRRRGRTRALLGLIFSLGAAALYYMLRFQMQFTLSRLQNLF